MPLLRLRLAAVATGLVAASFGGSGGGSAAPFAAGQSQATSMTFTAHEGDLCKQQDIPKDTKCNNKKDEDQCWSYWSDTDSLEQCKYQCQEHACECFGYKPDDTGYFHKCRMLLPGKWAHGTSHSSVGFTAYVPDRPWPPALNRPSSWLGSALLLLGAGYVGGGALCGVAKGRRGRAALPHQAFWSEVGALAKDGVAFSRSRVRGNRYGYRPLAASTSKSVHAHHQKQKKKKAGKDSKDSGSAAKGGKAKRGGSRAAEPAANAEGEGEDGGVSGGGGGLPAAAGAGTGTTAATLLQERRDGNVHSSMQKVKVVTLDAATAAAAAAAAAAD